MYLCSSYASYLVSVALSLGASCAVIISVAPVSKVMTVIVHWIVYSPYCHLAAFQRSYCHHGPSFRPGWLMVSIFCSLALSSGYLTEPTCSPIRYAKITRDLRRMDSVALSPLFSLWGEVISGGGISVVRAYGAQSRFMSTMLSRVDDQTSRFFHGFTVRARS